MIDEDGRIVWTRQDIAFAIAWPLAVLTMVGAVALLLTIIDWLGVSSG